jgi:hypothetical protein
MCKTDIIMVCYKGNSKVYLCQKQRIFLFCYTNKKRMFETELYFGLGYLNFEFYMGFYIITCEKQQTDFIYRRLNLLRLYSAGSWYVKYECRALVKWFWPRRNHSIRSKIYCSLNFPPQIPQRLALDINPASAVRGRRLRLWSMAGPIFRP